MDIELSADDLAFRDDVRSFFAENAHKAGEDYNQWRMDWFAKAKEKGGWDVPNGHLSSADRVGPQPSTTSGSRKPRSTQPPGTCPSGWACWPRSS